MSLIPDDLRFLEKLSSVDLERELLAFKDVNPHTMSDADLMKACVIHRLLARTTAGPAKKAPADQFKAMSTAEILDQF